MTSPTETAPREHEFTGDVTSPSVADRAKHALRESNRRYVAVTTPNGRRVLDVPLWLGIVAALIAPVPVLIGVAAALLTECSIALDRHDTKAIPTDNEGATV